MNLKLQRFGLVLLCVSLNVGCSGNYIFSIGLKDTGKLKLNEDTELQFAISVSPKTNVSADLYAKLKTANKSIKISPDKRAMKLDGDGKCNVSFTCKLLDKPSVKNERISFLIVVMDDEKVISNYDFDLFCD